MEAVLAANNAWPARIPQADRRRANKRLLPYLELEMTVLQLHCVPCWRTGLLVVASMVSACGSGETDPGADVGADEDETRVELIFVESESDSLASDPEPVAGAVLAPPAPTADDEVGGDDMLSYDADGKYTVQIGTFKNATRASARVRELESLGYPAYAVAHPSGDQVRVRVGYFPDRDKANKFGQRFSRDHGGKFWTDRRASEEVASR